MNHLLTMLRWDVDIQARNHIYTATVVSTAVICAFVLLMPWDPLPGNWTAVFVFLDPAAVGLAFVGATILMEKASGSTAAMGVTPMPSWVYMASKIISLSFLGVLSGIGVAWVATNGVMSWPTMIFALIISNVTACLIGFGMVARAASMNDLNIKLLMVGLVSYLPVLGLFDLVPTVVDVILYVSPSYAMMLLFKGAVDPASISTVQWVYGIGYQIAFIIAGWYWGLREYTASITTGGR